MVNLMSHVPFLLCIEPLSSMSVYVRIKRFPLFQTVVNEFVAYRSMLGFVASEQLSPRSVAILTYALAGFAHPSSVGILQAILYSLSPESSKTFSQVVMRGVVGGCAACFLTACVAGTLIDS